jgi:hypothetical protein
VAQLFMLIAGHINRQEVDMFPRLRSVAEPDQSCVPGSHPSTEHVEVGRVLEAGTFAFGR